MKLEVSTILDGSDWTSSTGGRDDDERSDQEEEKTGRIHGWPGFLGSGCFRCGFSSFSGGASSSSSMIFSSAPNF